MGTRDATYQNASSIKLAWRWRSSLNASTSDQLGSHIRLCGFLPSCGVAADHSWH